VTPASRAYVRPTVSDRLDRGPRVVPVLDHGEELARVAVAQLARVKRGAALEVRRARCGLGRRLVAIPTEDGHSRRAHPEDPHGDREGEEDAAAHGISRC
jgi:hypothetical protein